MSLKENELRAQKHAKSSRFNNQHDWKNHYTTT